MIRPSSTTRFVLANWKAIAEVKFAAKIASDLSKPDGLLEVPVGGTREFLAPLPVGRLWGVGPRTEELLASLGLATIGEVARADPEALARVLELGGLVSFTGIITFKTAQTMREVLAAVPQDRFMLETDSPYLAPEPFRGKRCEPALVIETAKMAAQVRQCPLEILSAATCATAQKFYKMDGNPHR